MPSPIGHALGGVAAAWLVAGRPLRGLQQGRYAPWRNTHGWQREALLYGAVGAGPDIDLLIGAHSMYTHSLGAVVFTGLAVMVWTRGARPRVALACAAAVASHILLDWLGSDTTPPIGIMALWPFTREFYQSPFWVFMAISRRWWLPGFYVQNGIATVREVAILLPLTALIAMLRTRPAPVEPG